jgi:hypothetical protein
MLPRGPNSAVVLTKLRVREIATRYIPSDSWSSSKTGITFPSELIVCEEQAIISDRIA